jgi:hypothetical protein
LVTALFKFYQQQTAKAVSLGSKKSIDVKEIVADLIDTLLSMQSVNLSLDDLYSHLHGVVSHQEDSLSFICLVLLSHGKDSVAVKDNLDLDSVEIKLVQRIVLQSKENALSLIEELLFLITCIPTSSS